jgi:predicted dehydrogenase
MVREGGIGDVVMLQADFGFQAGFNPEGRLFNPALGGGALLDVGVYPLSLASMLFGAPKGIAALMHLGETNVDVQTGAVLAYEDQKIALIATSVLADTLQDAILTGTAGRIRIHSPWWKPSAMTISTSGKNERIEVPYEANGFNHEVAEVMRRLRAGKLESDIMPLDETLSIMEVMDEIRRQGRLVYPGE